MTILHIIQALTPTAGTTVFVTELARLQQAMGHKVKIAVCNTHGCYCPADIEVVRIKNFHHFKFRPDIVHVHAVWSVFQANALKWCRSNQCKYVVSIHGCLMPRVFAKSPLKKWLFFFLFLRRSLQSAAFLHCTGAYEVEACKRLGLCPKCVELPLGVQLPSSSGTVHERDGKKTVLFIGRLAEEKGLEILLEAWRHIDNSEWQLIIAGPDWRGYKCRLMRKIAAQHICNVSLHGQVFGKAKEALYKKATLFVLPSPVENFSMVVAEALAYGIPVLATRGTPWNDLERFKCGWWINQGVDALENALREAMSLDDTKLNSMGNRGRSLIAQKYQWETIAKKIIENYLGIL